MGDRFGPGIGVFDRSVSPGIRAREFGLKASQKGRGRPPVSRKEAERRPEGAPTPYGSQRDS